MKLRNLEFKCSFANNLNLKHNIIEKITTRFFHFESDSTQSFIQVGKISIFSTGLHTINFF